VIQHIINAERYFWECVEKDTPPEADASESAAKALQLFIPNMYHSVPQTSLKIRKPINSLNN
jgi:predicted phage-related endonuclease